MSTTKVEALTIPYLSQNGKPFHKLSDAQRRWYTQGKLTQQEESELLMHAAMIEERVRFYQVERLRLRKQAGDTLTIREDTPVEERERRMNIVEGYKVDYANAGETIVNLKDSIFSVVPGNMVLEPVA